jgi:hypothetical protein
MLITGRSQMGKTTWVVEFIGKCMLSQITRLIVVCPTFRMQSCFDPLRRYVKESDIHDCISVDTFKRISRDIFRVQKELSQCNSDSERILVLVDDCAGSNAIHGNRQGAFAHLAVQTPHWNTSMFVITQNPTSVSPSFRENAENVVIFPSEGEAECLWLKRCYQSIGMEADLMERIISLAWRGGREDNEEWGKHFLLIMATPRTRSRFFIDFKKEIVIHGPG